MTKEQLAEDIIARMKSEMPYRLSDEIEPYVKEALTLMHEAAHPKWISVETELPPHLETVWISNGSNYVSLGCRVDFNYEDGWHWAESNGLIYIEDGKITAECESEDLDVKFWMHLPKPPSND